MEGKRPRKRKGMEGEVGPSHNVASMAVKQARSTKSTSNKAQHLSERMDFSLDAELELVESSYPGV